MHDIKAIRDEPEVLIRGLARRFHAKGADAHSEAKAIVDNLLKLDDARRAAIFAAQEVQEKRNALSKQIGQAMAAKDTARAEALKAEVAALKKKLNSFENEETFRKDELEKALANVPNMPLAGVPDGADEHNNIVYRTHGQKPEEQGGRLFGINNLKEHFEIGEALGQMDFEAAAKMSGSRFVVLNRGIARLSRALGQFFLDTHTQEHGYDEVMPPLLVRDDAMFGTAQLPKFEEDQFFTDPRAPNFWERIGNRIEEWARFTLQSSKTEYSTEEVKHIIHQVASNARSAYLISDHLERTGDDFSLETSKRLGLIPTAEVPLTNLVRESILDEDTLPRRYTALTPCFRAEAGSAGRDTRGMLRQHQFDKVELVSITTPDKSAEEHERMLECAENVLKKLGLHFRTMVLCTGDMGFASQKTYDIEVWLPGQKAYREISSCSVCGDFQARRMKAQYRPKDAAKGALPFVHTLNGSGVAVGRALIAVIENYQNADGSITVPDVLLPYMGGVTRIEKAN
jgi:seryl-tRNA synthetase